MHEVFWSREIRRCNTLSTLYVIVDAKIVLFNLISFIEILVPLQLCRVELLRLDFILINCNQTQSCLTDFNTSQLNISKPTET